jgi:glycosyltransferase involved in cell wall biosynthesis
MNILFIHEVDWRDKVVYEPHCLSESLSLLGHRVYAIDYESNWTRDGIFDFGSLKTREFKKVSRAYSKASVYLRRPGFVKIPGISRLSAGLTHYREIREIIRGNDIDVVVLYSAPTNGLQAISLSRKFEVPIVFRSIDILHQLVPHRILCLPIYLIERMVYSNVDLILALTPQLSQYVTRMGAKETKIKILPEGVDTDLFRPGCDCSQLRKKWGVREQDFIVFFMGTLFEFSGLDAFLYRFPELIKQIPEAKLLIVGDGPQRPKLERIAAGLRLKEQVVFTGFQPYETLPQYINLATICINPFLITKATADVFPAKVLQYLACGKGVIATPLPGMKSVILGEQQGIIYANSADDIIREIISLPKLAKRRKLLEETGLNYVRQVHSYNKIAKELETMLLQVVESRKPHIRKQLSLDKGR